MANNKKLLNQNINQNDHLIRCNSKSNSLCCTQLQSINIYKSLVTNKVFNIYNKPKRKSKYLIQLIECIYMSCNKRYTEKSETSFNLKLNKNQKYVNKQNSLQTDQHF